MARSPNIPNQETGVTSSDEEYLDFDDDNLRAIAEVYKDAGNDEYRNKKFANAMYFYTKGIKVNCKDDEIKAQLYSNRAITHFYQENYQDSLKDARTAVELNPACIKAIARGARACGKLGLYEEAITWCDKGLAISKNSKTFSDLRRESVTGLTKSQAENKEKAAREMENERGKIQNEVGSGASNESRQANIRILEFCLKTEQETGNKARQKTLLFMLVDALYLAGDIKKAIHYYGLLVQLAKEMNDRPAERTVYGILGNLYNRLAEYEKAFHYHELHLQLAKETCDRTVEGVAYGFLGNDYRCVGDLKKAIYYFELELNISKEVGNRVTEGMANHNLGNFFKTEGNFKKAIKCFEISSQIAKESHDRIREGNVCGSLGNVYQALGELSKAIHYHKLYRKITQELGDRSGEGKALGSLGSDYYLLGDFKTAIYYHELSLQIAKDVRDRRGEGIGYRRLGRDLQCLGHFKEAISYHELSLKFSREVNDRWEEGEVYGDLGDDYYHLGDFKKALHYFELHLQIAKEERYKLSERFAYGSLGSVYQQLGDFRKAIYYHELALNIAQELGLKTCGSDYGNLGCAYGRLGDFETALHYGELHLKFTKDVGDRHQEGRAYGYLGSNYLKLGKFKKAILYHERELEMAREDGSKLEESFAYNHLAVDFATLGDTEKAIYFHEKQLQISKEVEDKNGEGQAYGNLGLCFYKLRDFRKAKAYMEHSLTIAKSTGNKVEEAEGYSCLGLNYNEMGLLSEAVDHWKASIRILNEVRDCLQFQDKWKISLRQQYQTTYGHLWHGLLRQGKAVEALIAAEQGRAQALKDLMQIKYGFETWKDDLSSVEKTLHSTLRCLPSNTIFEAAVGKQVYFWVIQGGEMEIVQLTCKEVGDNQAVDFDAFVSSLKTKAFEEIGVRAGVKCEDRSLEKRYGLKCSVGSHPCQSPPLLFEENSLRTLYNFIIDPIVNLVSGDELLIVPEGNLWLAPYAALLDSNSKYLSESFRIRMIPSLTIWKLIADCPADYHLNRGALLVGDPWVQEIITPKKKKLEQLPCAREEVRMIGKILNTAPLIGTDATKEEVLKRLSSVALVHIAAHGRLETGEIALTPNPSSSSQPPKEEDYLLTMTDVLNVNLRARLVVLSSCHSGRGDVKAEGVVGIARAFLGAGARSVLVSQWAIDDEATLEFMKLFYIKLAEGRRASEALNQAMKSMRESDAFNEVKYWAPFVLIGDDVNLNFRASSEALHPEHYSETESE